jgi:hypothetical protein
MLYKSLQTHSRPEPQSEVIQAPSTTTAP